MKVKKIEDVKEINGIDIDEVYRNREDIRFNKDDVFVIYDNYGIAKEIQFAKIIKSHYNLDVNLSIDEVIEKYLEIKKQEEEKIQHENITLEGQGKRMDILQAEKEKLIKITKDQDKLLVDNAYKIAILEMNMGGM